MFVNNTKSQLIGESLIERSFITEADLEPALDVQSQISGRFGVINDQFGAPTGVDLIADITAHVIRAVKDAPDLSGLYKTADYYSQDHECCIMWNDPELNINWQLEVQPPLSKKAQNGMLFKNARLYS